LSDAAGPEAGTWAVGGAGIEWSANKGDIVIEMLARQARVVLDAAEGGDA